MFSASGSIHAAAIICLSLIIIAPSCSGVLGSNMFSTSGADITPSMRVPVAAISPKAVFCSITISAPTLRFARSVIASCNSETIVESSWLKPLSTDLSNRLPRPMCSSARLNSGWNSTTASIKPLLRNELKSQLNVCICNKSHTTAHRNSIPIPLST